MASVVDDAVVSALNAESAKQVQAASDSRVRAWDQLAIGIAASSQVYLTSPSVFAGQGVRMLNGTPTMAPGNAPNANHNGAA